VLLKAWYASLGTGRLICFSALLFAVGSPFQMPEQTQGKHEGSKTLIGQLCVVLAYVLSKGKVTPEAIADKWAKVGCGVMLEMNIPMHSTESTSTLNGTAHSFA
jgi:hypothetical protein